jgi:hypothetical protein
MDWRVQTGPESRKTGLFWSLWEHSLIDASAIILINKSSGSSL